MKTLNLIFTLTSTLLLSGVSYSQNITNTLGTSGTFTIKDGSTNYFTLSQSTGNVSLFRNMELGGITNSTSTRGVVTKNGLRFIHNYQAPGTDGRNTFIGLEAGNFTMSGSVFVEASYNTGVGYRSQYLLTTGGSNSAFGYVSLYNNTTGNANTAIGNLAGSNITTGSNNIAIGYDAQVPSGSASNQIRLGNTSITYAGIQVAWTITSDRRYKENIAPIGLGLGFISKLNPVSYQRKNDENKKTEYGLIAQEVEQVLKDLGIENHAMLTITDEGMYELRYNDLLAPMIKAIQELKEQNEKLKVESDSEIAKLKEENQQLRNEIQSVKSLSDEVEKLKQIVNSLNLNLSDIKLTGSLKEDK